MNDQKLMEKIVSVCKGRGFVFPGSEIYGGFAGTYDYGHLGLRLKENIERLWLQMFRDSRDDMYGVDAAILMNPKVWEASGHVRTFADPLTDGKMFNTMFKTSVRHRANREGVSKRDRAARLHLPLARTDTNGSGIFREAE